MLNVEFTLNVLSLILMIAGCFFIGYSLRSRQLKKKQYKIADLRKEIVYNHAHILELQKEYVTLEMTMNGTIAPVLPIKTTINETHKLAEGGR